MSSTLSIIMAHILYERQTISFCGGEGQINTYQTLKNYFMCLNSEL